jgi:similar to spore coat protein
LVGKLAPHEALELHEVLRLESVSASKLQMMMPLVKDNDLKSYMQDCLQSKQDNMQAMQAFAKNAAH